MESHNEKLSYQYLLLELKENIEPVLIKFGSESISCVVQEALLSGRHQAQFNGMGMHECVPRTGWGGLLALWRLVSA